MTTWWAQIVGDDFDVRMLLETLNTQDLRVIEDRGEFYLYALSFDRYSDPTQVRDYAVELTATIMGALRVQYQTVGAVKVGAICRVHDDGRRNFFVFPAPMEVGARAFAVAHVSNGQTGPPPPPSPGSTVSSRVEIALRCPPVEMALRFLAAELNWFNLYKISEVIEHDMGGPRAIEARGWATKAQIDHFTRSANNYRATGMEARHARVDWKPMKQSPMTLKEAQAFIRALLDNWIRTK